MERFVDGWSIGSGVVLVVGQRCECCALCSLVMHFGKVRLSANGDGIHLLSPTLMPSLAFSMAGLACQCPLISFSVYIL